MKTGILLFAHGSRSVEWAAPFARIQERVAARRADAHVSLAYLELMSPDFRTAVDELVAHAVTHISVVPLFLAMGGHLRHDLPALVSDSLARHPHLRIRILPPIGESETLPDAIAEWAAKESSFEG